MRISRGLPSLRSAPPLLSQVNSSAVFLSQDAIALISCITEVVGALNASQGVAGLLSGNLSMIGSLASEVNSSVVVLGPPLASLTANLTALSDPVTGLPAAYSASEEGAPHRSCGLLIQCTPAPDRLDSRSHHIFAQPGCCISCCRRYAVAHGALAGSV